MTKTTISERRAVRAAAGETWTAMPVEVVGGDQAPALAGRSYYWTTLSGRTEVRHPNAYGWPTLYHASTRRIVVGEGWLIAQGLRAPALADVVEIASAPAAAEAA